MIIKRLWLTDFRNHHETDVELNHNTTLVVGLNGHGKTNLIEGLHLLTGARSFRGAKVDALIKSGKPSAYIRAEVEQHGRLSLVEIELTTQGRSKAQINKQKVKRFRDLGDTVRAVVFSPDDLELIKGTPSIRRALLDDTIAIANPEFRAVRTDFDHILRQRNNLLKQAKGRMTSSLEANLSIWNEQLVEAAQLIGDGREDFITKFEPLVSDYYQHVAGRKDPILLQLDAEWRTEGLAEALLRSQNDEVRRGMTLVGPHRDDLTILLKSLHSRSHASQGEQRSLALALRLATYLYIEEASGDQPLILLDDVFSELDESRARLLVECLPEAQIILTSATGTVPDGVDPSQTLNIIEGQIHE
ncbi:MAG: DNA replication/repair protein RecF [Acidimicrobiales bacterium]|nr:DNA replication/repair protein RecF [Acidimicrobiales bacterium]